MASHALSITDAFAMATVVGASRDLLASEVPFEGQSVEACWDSEADLASGAAEAPRPDIVSV